MSARSIWHAAFTEIEVRSARIRLAARNDHGTRRFEFSYGGVLKVQIRLLMPSLPGLRAIALTLLLGAQAERMDFATIKTAPYEQWLGGGGVRLAVLIRRVVQ